MSSLKELQDLIQEKYDIAPGALNAHAPMLEQGLDSLALVEFLFEVEDRLQISLPDTQSDVHTLAGLAQVIDQIRATQAA